MSMGHMGKYETVCFVEQKKLSQTFKCFAELKPWQIEKEKAFSGVLKRNKLLVSVGKTNTLIFLSLV